MGQISLLILYISVCTLFTVIKCDAPKVDNAVRIEGKSPPYSYNNFLRYKCKEGYRMEGSAYLKCDVNGWNPPPPVCIGIEPCFYVLMLTLSITHCFNKKQL